MCSRNGSWELKILIMASGSKHQWRIATDQAGLDFDPV